MNMTIEQTQYRSSISKPIRVVSGVLSEAAMYVMQSEDLEWGDAIDEMLSIRNYEVNFDGEGSFPPPIEIVDTALRFSELLKNDRFPAPGRVSASVNGTIVFEWYLPHFYHQLEFVLPTEAEATFILNDSSEVRFFRVRI